MYKDVIVKKSEIALIKLFCFMYVFFIYVPIFVEELMIYLVKVSAHTNVNACV